MIKPRTVFQEKGGQRECVMTTCNLNQNECPYGYFCDSDNVCTLMSQGICKECPANEGPVRIQYNCLISIYVFSEMKLLFPKHNYNVLSPSSYIHVSVRDLYISRIYLPVLLFRDICGQILGTYKSLTVT